MRGVASVLVGVLATACAAPPQRSSEGVLRVDLPANAPREAESAACRPIAGRQQWSLTAADEKLRRVLDEATARGVTLVRATRCGISVVATVNERYEERTIASCEEEGRDCASPRTPRGCPGFTAVAPDEIAASLSPPAPDKIALLDVLLVPLNERRYEGSVVAREGATHFVRVLTSGKARVNGVDIRPGPLTVELVPLGESVDSGASATPPMACDEHTQWNGILCEASCWSGGLGKCLELCDRGSGVACVHAADLVADDQRRLSLLRKACEAGYADGCLSAFHSTLDSSEMETFLARGCGLSAFSESGAELCWEQSKLLSREGNGAAARDKLRAACAGRFSLACAHIIPSTPEDAETISRACAQCDGDACVALARARLAAATATTRREVVRRALELVRPYCHPMLRVSCPLIRSLGGHVPPEYAD